MRFLKYENTADTIYTMHGYLRIIDKDVLDTREMYNGHPGLITKYPELKGKDPQETVAKNLSLYDKIGSVIHKVTPEVDSGEILYEFAVFNGCNSREEVYDTLKLTSLHSWLAFFKDKFECE
jgi:folate-dependent phosphoribosylglycinamide formyltransferase PurN